MNNISHNEYEIKRGDTLYSISKEFNVPLALLMRVNPYVDIYNLQIGDLLSIPSNNHSKSPELLTYVVVDDETLQEILDKLNMTLNEFLEFNSISNLMIHPGTTLIYPKL